MSSRSSTLGAHCFIPKSVATQPVTPATQRPLYSKVVSSESATTPPPSSATVSKKPLPEKPLYSRVLSPNPPPLSYAQVAQIPTPANSLQPPNVLQKRQPTPTPQHTPSHLAYDCSTLQHMCQQTIRSGEGRIHVAAIESMLNHMRRTQIPIDTGTYISILDAYSKFKASFTQIKILLKYMQEAQVEWNSQLLKAVSNTSKGMYLAQEEKHLVLPPQAMQFLAQTLKTPSVTRRDDLSYFIGLSKQGKDPQTTQRILNYMKNNGIALSASDYENALQAYGYLKKGSFKAIVKLFDEMRQFYIPTTPAYESLLKAYTLAGNPRQAFNILNCDMKKYGLKPNDTCCSIVISGYYDKARKLEIQCERENKPGMSQPSGTKNPWLDECIQNFPIQGFLDRTKTLYSGATQNLAEIYRKSYMWNQETKVYKYDQAIQLCDRVLDAIDISKDSTSWDLKERYYAAWVIKLTVLFESSKETSWKQRNASQAALKAFHALFKAPPPGFDNKSKSWTRFLCVEVWKGGYNLTRAKELQEALKKAPQTKNNGNAAIWGDIGRALAQLEAKINPSTHPKRGPQNTPPFPRRRRA